ncbi:MAG: hypothetical protein RIQ37_443 [Actinomycetota bacterium]|jgi:PTS system fructose-specific IIC component
MAKIVAVTSCITGIAHTYMAAEALEQAAKKLGHEIWVETQGSAGSNPLKQEIIDAADFAIFGVDLEVNGRERFNGKPYIQVPVAKAMSGATALVEKAVAGVADGSLPKVGEAKPAAPKNSSSEPTQKKGGLFGGLFGKK